MVGGIPMGLVLGPLCDQYGVRILNKLLLVGGAIPCLCTGIATNLHG
jgi:nitrate/nitrite transporter NarK